MPDNRNPDYAKIMSELPDPRGREWSKPAGYRLGEIATIRTAGLGETKVVASSATPLPRRARGPYVKRTDTEKLAILDEYDAAPYGEKNKVLTKHHVGYPALTSWGKLRDGGRLAAITRTADQLPAVNPDDLIDDQAASAASKVEQIAGQLERWITDGTLQPGTKLRSRARIAELFGVSGATAGVVIRLLAARGLIKTQGHRMYVAGRDRQEMAS